MEQWHVLGSDWSVEKIELFYVKIARYDPILVGSYLPLLPNLANKKAIVNVKNKDKECLKWVLRAALFSPKDGKDAQRQSKYPVNDGINYEGIDFPTPIKQINKLEKQNRNLAISVCGWEDDNVVIHRISERREEKNVKLVNLMLLEKGTNQHYCWIKRESALLFDPKKNNKTFYCTMCLTRFSREHVLMEHKKYCKGVNGRPTRVVMPEEGENILSFQNQKKKMKKPYVIYADFEAIVKKIQGCERGAEWGSKCYTERTELHLACGYSFIVVRCDGKVVGSKPQRGENAAEEFFRDILYVEKKIRESLTTPKKTVMTCKDWEDIRKVDDCHICNRPLIKEEFMDSLPVWNIEKVSEEASEKWSYWGQGHRKCFYEAQYGKENQRPL